MGEVEALASGEGAVLSSEAQSSPTILLLEVYWRRTTPIRGSVWAPTSELRGCSKGGRDFLSHPSGCGPCSQKLVVGGSAGGCPWKCPTGRPQMR